MKSVLKKVHHCDICKKTFRSSYKLKSHLFYHKAVAARFKCPYCLKEFYRKDEYTRHVASHNNKQKLHSCDHCGRGFVDKRNLLKHLYIHDDLHVPFKRYKCIACDVSYCEERLLKYHIRKNHMNLDANSPAYTKKKLNDSWIESAMDSKSCVQMTKVSNNVLSIKKCKIKAEVEHETEKINNPKKNQSKKVLTNETVQHFLASAFAQNYGLYSRAVCDYCNKNMLKKSLINHIRERHTKMRRFHCLVCKRSFNRHYHLSEHICGKVGRTRKNNIGVMGLATRDVSKNLE